MTEAKICPRCGAEIPRDAPTGICPKCLMRLGFASEGETEDTASRAGQPTVASPGGTFVPPEIDSLAPHFPRLEILALLGAGGMGAVYQARQTRLDRLVALKIIRPESAHDPAFAERFNREARTLARLSHPHIVTIHDFGEVTLLAQKGNEAGRCLYYFLMEYVDGVNLRQLMEAGQLQPEQALAIIPQVCEALQYAHDKQVIHRDIKPENILLDGQGQVKIADFGLAKLTKSPEDATLTGTYQVMGTPRYMAPEQMEGSHAVDHRADIFSLGVVFYEMLTGQTPMGHFDPPSKKVNVDVRLDEVVLRSMAREPERRYQRASEVKSDVESISQCGPSPPPAARDFVATSKVPADAHAATIDNGPRSSAHAVDFVEVESELSGPSLAMMVVGLLIALGHVISVVICLNEPYGDDLAWLGALGILVGLGMFVGGLSMHQLGSRSWSQLGVVAGLVPASPGWLIGAAISIWANNALQQPHVRRAFVERHRERRRMAQHDVTATPRFSRAAILGACWIPFFFVAIACTVFPVYTLRAEPAATVLAERIDEQAISAERLGGAQWWQWALLLTVLPLGLTAPFGTTILGLVATSKIRHSQGRLTGMPLALVDALLFPLLALNCFIVAVLAAMLGFLLVFISSPDPHMGLSAWPLTILLSLPICALVDGLIARAAWRRATASL